MLLRKSVSPALLFALVLCYAPRTAFSEGEKETKAASSYTQRLSDINAERQRLFGEIESRIKAFVSNSFEFSEEDQEKLVEVLIDPDFIRSQEYASSIKKLLDGGLPQRRLVLQKVLPMLDRNIPALGVLTQTRGNGSTEDLSRIEKNPPNTLYEEIGDYFFRLSKPPLKTELKDIIHSRFLEGVSPQRASEWIGFLFPSEWRNRGEYTYKLASDDLERLGKLAELVFSKPSGLTHSNFTDWMNTILGNIDWSTNEKRLLGVLAETVMRQPEILNDTNRPLAIKFINKLVGRIQAGGYRDLDLINYGSTENYGNLLTKILVQTPKLRKGPEFETWLNHILSSLSNGAARMPGLLALLDTEEARELLRKSDKFSDTLREVIFPRESTVSYIRPRIPQGQTEAVHIIRTGTTNSSFSEEMRNKLLEIFLADDHLTGLILKWWVRNAAPSPEQVKEKVLALLDGTDRNHAIVTEALEGLAENHKSTEALRDFLIKGKVNGPLNLPNLLNARSNLLRKRIRVWDCGRLFGLLCERSIF